MKKIRNRIREQLDRMEEKQGFEPIGVLVMFLCIFLLIGLIGGAEIKETAKRTAPQIKPTQENIKLLAQLMYAENGSHKDDRAVMLTGVVVLKRVQSMQYPDTLKGVICQKGQYSTKEKALNCQPDERCMEIAEELLRGKVYKKYPASLVFQSEFRQGKVVYLKTGQEYFCCAKKLTAKEKRMRKKLLG